MTSPNNWAADLDVAKAMDGQHRREMLDTFPGSRTTFLIAEGGIQSCLQKAIEDNHNELVVPAGGASRSRTPEPSLIAIYAAFRPPVKQNQSPSIVFKAKPTART